LKKKRTTAKKKGAAKAPKKLAAKPKKKAAAKAPKKAPAKALKKAAAKAPKKAAAKASKKAVGKAPKKAAAKVSKKTAAKAPKKAPPKASKKAPAKALKKAAKAAKKAPARAAKKKASEKAVVKLGAAKTPAAAPEKSVVKFDPLQRYLSEISQYSLLTREQERELGIKVKEHQDPDAAYVLITSNLRLVVKIALEYQRVWMQNLLDLIQEGNIGLMQAVRKFDPYKNVKFSYYASFWIKAYILKFIMDNWRLVKIGTTQGQRKLFFKLKKEKQKLIERGFDPKPKMLSERLGVSEREIIDMDQRLDGWDVSLDAPLKDDSDTERMEFMDTDEASIEDQVAKKEMESLLHEKIHEFRAEMTPRELEIFDQRIFSDSPVTLQEIGDRYSISRERVRQIEKNIIKKMREFFKKGLPDFASYTEDIAPD